MPNAHWARNAQGGTPAIVTSAWGVPQQDPIRGVPGPHWQRAKRTLGAQRAGETASNRYGGWKNLQVKNQRLDVTHGMQWIVPQAPPPPSAMLTAMVPTQVEVETTLQVQHCTEGAGAYDETHSLIATNISA